MKLIHKIYGLLALLLMGSASLQAQDDPFGDFNPRLYQGNMQLTAQVRQNGNIVTNAVIAVYCGDELRGKDRVGNGTNPDVAYLTVYGDYTGNNQYLYFKVYTAGQIYTITPTTSIVYEFNGIVGSGPDPYLITLPDISPVNITMNSAGIMTYCSEYPLDFSNATSETTDAELKAYVVSDFSPSQSSISLTKVDKVPANTGLLLEGTPGAVFTVPVVVTDKTWTNLLVGVTNAKTVVSKTETRTVDDVETQFTNFILANGSHGINWYTLSTSGSIGANKAYLSLKTSDVNAFTGTRLIWLYDDDETAHLTTTRFAELMHTADGWYDLSGRQLSCKPTKKGLYINHGKKVVIK